MSVGGCRGDGEGTSDPLNIFYFLLLASIWSLGVNFAGGGWSEELKRGVIVKGGVCVAEGLFDTSSRLFEDGGGVICCCDCQ